MKVASLASTQLAYVLVLHPSPVAADISLSELRCRLWVVSLQRHQRHCREHDVPGATRPPCQDDDRPLGLGAHRGHRPEDHVLRLMIGLPLL